MPTVENRLTAFIRNFLLSPLSFCSILFQPPCDINENASKSEYYFNGPMKITLVYIIYQIRTGGEFEIKTNIWVKIIVMYQKRGLIKHALNSKSGCYGAVIVRNDLSWPRPCSLFVESQRVYRPDSVSTYNSETTHILKVELMEHLPTN